MTAISSDFRLIFRVDGLLLTSLNDEAPTNGRGFGEKRSSKCTCKVQME